MTEKIGIAVSIHDKFDDLAILHDIVRENFEKDYFIGVYCNHPNAEEEILEKRDLEIDSLVTGEITEFTEGMQRHMRILNCVKQACKSCIKDCSYVMHLHADAWPLEEKKIHELIESLERRDQKVAVRGKGTTYRLRSSYRTGMVMDQFFVFETEYFRENQFFNFKITDPMPHWGVHDSLMLLLLGRIGRSKIYFYSDMKDDVYWDEKPTFGKYAVRPSAYDPKWRLFHCARDEFPKNYGEKIQARRLKSQDITKGKHVEKLLEKHENSFGETVENLKKIEKIQNFKLMSLLYRPRNFGRAFKRKEEILDHSFGEKWKIRIENLLAGLYFRANSLVFSYLPYKNRARKKTDLSMTAKWPKKDKELYKEKLNDSKIIEEEERKWFER